MGNASWKMELKSLHFIEVDKYIYNLEQTVSSKHLQIDKYQSSKIGKNNK